MKNDHAEASNLSQSLSLGMIFGVAIGTSIGQIKGNMSLYMVLGACIGMLIGTVLGVYKDKNNNNKSDDTDATGEDADVILDIEENKSIPYIETPEFREKVEEWKIGFEEREKKESERKERALQETLNRFNITREDIEPITNDAIKRNYYNGIYHVNPKEPSGSVDNPIVVGIPEYSNSLVFIPERGGWCLTDGLGNGYIR